jgi:hypothetical protein
MLYRGVGSCRPRRGAEPLRGRLLADAHRARTSAAAARDLSRCDVSPSEIGAAPLRCGLEHPLVRSCDLLFAIAGRAVARASANASRSDRSDTVRDGCAVLSTAPGRIVVPEHPFLTSTPCKHAACLGGHRQWPAAQRSRSGSRRTACCAASRGYGLSDRPAP